MSQTWVIKDTAPVDEASRTLTVSSISFTTNGDTGTSIIIEEQSPGAIYALTYGGVGEVAGMDLSSGIYSFEWNNEAYKTLEFDTAPTGELLAWLQKNADLQVDTEYLTRKSELTSVANAIRAKGGTSAPLVYPDGFVTAIQSIDTTGGRKPATVTITSSDYTGNRYGSFIYPTLEGHIENMEYNLSNKTFTFPVTINTVIGGLIVISLSGFPGLPYERNVIGSEVSKYQGQFTMLVTSPQASMDIVNND